MITHCFIDADPICYRGATSKEKMRYYWKRGEEESEMFNNAVDADDFIVSQELMDDVEGWERIGKKDIPKLEEVLEATDSELNNYLNTAKRLTGNPDLIFIGYLTGSGRKSKDIDGLEHMYQNDRDPSKKPFYLKEAREYLLTTRDWVKMCPKGYEADAILMARSEKKGKKAVLEFIDKDLRGSEKTNLIDMTPKESVIEFSEEVQGKLYLNEKGKVKGYGFMWEFFQALAGDTADTYKGLKGLGEKGAYKLLVDCQTKEEVVKTCYETYLKKYPEGVFYMPQKYPEDRPQKEQFRTAYELLEQHINLAHQERRPKDYFKLSDYISESWVDSLVREEVLEILESITQEIKE